MMDQWMEIMLNAALLIGGGAGGAAFGYLSKKKAALEKEPEPNSDKALIQAAARKAGFDPGDTGQFQKLNSLGAMRCNGHQSLVDGQTAILDAMRNNHKEVKEALSGINKTLIANAREAGSTDARLTNVENDVDRLKDR